MSFWKRYPLKRKYRFIFGNILVAALLSLFLVKNVVSASKIEGNSMCPTLQEGDKVIVYHLDSDISNIKRFDVVVFRRPGDANLVKRVVGLPGEKIEINRDQILINHKELSTPPYLKGDLLSDFPAKITIPAKSFFLVGDNRGSSFDSRNFGPVHYTAIIGKAVMRYWPPHKIGSIK